MTPIAGNVGIIGSLRNYSTDGLIANVDFNNDYGFAGNTAHDLQKPAIKYNTPGGFVSVVSGSTARPGSIKLDGVTDYLIATAGATGGVSEFSSWTAGTIDIWLYLNNLTGGPAACGNNGTNFTQASDRGFCLIWGNVSPTQPRLSFSNGSINAVATIPGLTGITGQWMNCFARFQTVGSAVQGTGVLFKPNGLSAYDLITGVTIASAAAGVTSNNRLAIGRRSVTATQYLDGQVGSVRIYNRLLSQSEIEFNYNRSKTRYGHI